MDEQRFADMISKVAHELRSPLTSLKGFSTTLVNRWERFTDEQRRELVATIRYDADRMARIVSEVLDLARVESGRLELKLRNTPVAAVARRAGDFVAESTGSDRIEIDVDDELTVRADPDRLEQVLVNLLENAVKFSDHGPVRVESGKSEDWVSIAVSDRGVGIASERIPGLFSGPATVADSSTGHFGTGLGLYLARRLVEAHGGAIEVASEAGAGSTFTVRLPGRPS